MQKEIQAQPRLYYAPSDIEARETSIEEALSLSATKSNESTPTKNEMLPAQTDRNGTQDPRALFHLVGHVFKIGTRRGD